MNTTTTTTTSTDFARMSHDERVDLVLADPRAARAAVCASARAEVTEPSADIPDFVVNSYRECTAHLRRRKEVFAQGLAMYRDPVRAQVEARSWREHTYDPRIEAGWLLQLWMIEGGCRAHNIPLSEVKRRARCFDD